MTKNQRVYGKGRYDGFFIGMIATALVLVVGFLSVKKDQATF